MAQALKDEKRGNLRTTWQRHTIFLSVASKKQTTKEAWLSNSKGKGAPVHCTEVAVQLYALTALPQWKESPVFANGRLCGLLVWS